MRALWVRARANFPQRLQDMRLHECRHLCASLLAMHGATDVGLAAQLGHSTLAMVKRYSHLRGGHRGAVHDPAGRGARWPQVSKPDPRECGPASAPAPRYTCHKPMVMMGGT